MAHLEQSKYMQPHYSPILRDMILEINNAKAATSRLEEQLQTHFVEDPFKFKVKLNTMDSLEKDFQDIYEKE